MQNEEKTKMKESEETLEGSHYRNWLREWRNWACVLMYTVYTYPTRDMQVCEEGEWAARLFSNSCRDKRDPLTWTVPNSSWTSSFSFKTSDFSSLNVFPVVLCFSTVSPPVRRNGQRKTTREKRKGKTERIWWLAESKWRARVKEELSDFRGARRRSRAWKKCKRTVGFSPRCNPATSVNI